MPEPHDIICSTCGDYLYACNDNDCPHANDHYSDSEEICDRCSEEED